MGFFSEFMAGMCEAIVDANKPQVSDYDTCLDFTSHVEGDLITDDQYLKVFSNAIRILAKKWSTDTYLRHLAYRGCIKAREEGSSGNTYGGNFAVWRVYCGESLYDSIKLRFRTPNATQKDREGKLIVSGSYYSVMSTDYYSNRQPITSFLGVDFGADAGIYEEPGAKTMPTGDGLLIVSAEMNHLMQFDSYMILKSEDKNEVVGVVCRVDFLERQESDLFVEQLCSVLSEKYARVWDSDLDWRFDSNSNEKNMVL